MNLPPAFQGDPGAYAFALFGCLIVAFVSASQLWYMVKFRVRIGYKSMLSVRTAFVLAGFFTAFIIGVLPDILVLLLWGEVSSRTMHWLRIIDRVADGLILFPFLFSVVVLLRIRHGVVQLIDKIPPYQQHPYLSSWVHIRRQLGIVVLAGTVSAGIVVGKITNSQGVDVVIQDNRR